MNKEEIQKRLVEVKSNIDSTLSKAMILTREQINDLELSYAEMERLQFQLRSLEDESD